MRQADERSPPVFPLLVATAFGAGYTPVAPGTFGSAAGLVLWLFLPRSTLVQGAVVVALFVLGSWSATIAERHFDSTDPGAVVIDEATGMLITLFMVPVGWVGACAGFLLFRIFDIIKPFPARRLESLHGGVGIMADDAAAAVYANVVLRVILAIW